VLWIWESFFSDLGNSGNGSGLACHPSSFSMLQRKAKEGERKREDFDSPG